METFFQQLVNGLSLGSIYALIALGYTMVYGILRLINFAHGDVYMVGAYAGYYLSTAMRGGQPSFFKAAVVMLGAMVVCAALGVVIERFAYRPVRGAPKLTSLITAIGVSLLLENGGQLVFGADPKFFPSLAPAPRAGGGRPAPHLRAADGLRGRLHGGGLPLRAGDEDARPASPCARCPSTSTPPSSWASPPTPSS